MSRRFDYPLLNRERRAEPFESRGLQPHRRMDLDGIKFGWICTISALCYFSCRRAACTRRTRNLLSDQSDTNSLRNTILSLKGGASYLLPHLGASCATKAFRGFGPQRNRPPNSMINPARPHGQPVSHCRNADDSTVQPPKVNCQETTRSAFIVLV
jgi:hypothetical protein